MKEPFLVAVAIAFVMLNLSCKKQEDSGCLGCNAYNPCMNCVPTHISKSISGTITENCNGLPYAGQTLSLNLQYTTAQMVTHYVAATGVTDSSGYFNIPYSFQTCVDCEQLPYGSLNIQGPRSQSISLYPGGWEMTDVMISLADTMHLFYYFESDVVTDNEDTLFLRIVPTDTVWTTVPGPFIDGQQLGSRNIAKGELQHNILTSFVALEWRFNDEPVKEIIVNHQACSPADTAVIQLQ